MGPLYNAFIFVSHIKSFLEVGCVLIVSKEKKMITTEKCEGRLIIGGFEEMNPGTWRMWWNSVGKPGPDSILGISLLWGWLMFPTHLRQLIFVRTHVSSLCLTGDEFISDVLLCGVCWFGFWGKLVQEAEKQRASRSNWTSWEFPVTSGEIIHCMHSNSLGPLPGEKAVLFRGTTDKS